MLLVDQGRGMFGAQRVLLRLAPLLVARGITPVLGSPPGLDLALQWQAAGFGFHELDIPLDHSIRTQGDTGPISVARLAREAAGVPRAVGAIARGAAETGADVVLANAHWTHLDAALAGLSGRVPTLLYLHEQSVPGFGTRLRRLACTLARGAIAVSADVAEQVKGGPRTTVVPNGVDIGMFHPTGADPATRRELGAQPGDILVTALTRLDPVKRIEDLIDAVAGISDPRVRLAVAGATSQYPDYAAEVTARAERMLGGRVRFVGERSDVPAVLNASDVVAHCGTVEGMPLGLLEAQACGIPVVAYRAAGVPQIVADGETGFVVPALDVGTLRAALARLTQDATLRERLGAQGRRRVVDGFSLTAQADRVAARVRAEVA
ncbi:glycosyltransferase family 4 protein [Propionicicella superfundia]|uniref:glycosyltransferase family 4 protein n=1 Tax=Propionicicella superfundia TaxID=348582 RepID=UPI00146E9FEF|nr:glycosyltransferase family 4 protein [Propionicicella superfundia]